MSPTRSRLFLYISLMLLAGGCTPMSFKITPISADRTLEERVVYADGGWVGEKVAIIDIDGVLLNSHTGGLWSPGEHPVSLLAEKLQLARRDPQVRAVILRINSPGGSVTASDLMYDEVRRFRTCGKPVVAVLMDVAASGGYYIACAADEIIAHPTTITGSIGVVMLNLNISGSLEMIGARAEAIKSGPHKDAGSMFREMTPEERQVFQTMIDEMYERFVTVVQEGRPQLTREKILPLADGRIYTARQAEITGLVDRLGSIYDGLQSAKARAGISRCKAVIYQRPEDWTPNVYAESTTPPPLAQQISLINLDWPAWLTPGTTHIMYLWLPSGSH
ncbi:MAG: putative signal peptide peptidase SppA [Phycisphaerae bacterium]|nr:putative signal peptide peptidase SppA [Phycisphaerae bacterium]